MPTLQDLGTPKDNIIIWSGTLASVPSNFNVCDGTNGTPDLRSLFVKSVPDTMTDPGTTGGSDTHALVTAELAQHGHSVTDPTHSHRYGTGNALDPGDSAEQVSDALSLSSVSVGNTGSGNAHENRPAFYEVIFIQRK